MSLGDKLVSRLVVNVTKGGRVDAVVPVASVIDVTSGGDVVPTGSVIVEGTVEKG